MTHIQTEVPEEDYERLRAIAQERGLSIRDALKEAAELWIEHQERVDPDDALFRSVETVREDHEREPQPATSVGTEADLVEEWPDDCGDLRVVDPESETEPTPE